MNPVKLLSCQLALSRIAQCGPCSFACRLSPDAHAECRVRPVRLPHVRPYAT